MMGTFFKKKENKIFLLIIAALTIFCAWQESQIADLQERMMNVEASRYDEHVSNLWWKARATDEKLEEMEKDILHLQKSATEHSWRIQEIEWDR